MYARVTTTQSSPDQADQVINMVKERIIPTVQQWKGFKGGIWLADRESGKGMGVVVWETEEDLRASGEAARSLREQIAQAGGAVASPTWEEYEVIAQI